MGLFLRRRTAMLAAFLALAVLPATTPRAQPPGSDLVVFAAASLRNALDDADTRFTAAGHVPVRVSYAASSTLARQIAAGAPADVFISADLDWMDWLAERHLIRTPTRSNLLGNTLVLVAPAASRLALAIRPGFPLAAALGGGRLAVADPAAVPAGRYAKAALENLGVWDVVAGHLAPAENVRAALLLVERGEVPLGIVYRTDAAADAGVRIVATFPAATHKPIIYPIALLSSTANPAAVAYLAFLRSPAARQAFEKQGFAMLP